MAIALIAGAVHVFRKDLFKIAGVLKRPAQNFVKDVQDEMKKTAAEQPQPKQVAPNPESKPDAAEDKKLS